MLRYLTSRALLAVTLCLVAVTFIMAAPDKGKGKSGSTKPAPQAKVEGTITAIGASSVTITRRGGVSVTVGVAATTKIERNDRHVSLATFKVGDRGEALFNPTTLLASKVEAVGP